MTYKEQEIPEANGYTVDTLGIVRNKKKDKDKGGKEIGKIKYDNGEMVNEYRKVSLLGKQKPVHRLVAIAFIPNPENKPTVNHIAL